MDLIEIADEILSDPMDLPFTSENVEELKEFLDHINMMFGELSEFPLVEISPEDSGTYVYFIGDLHGDLLTAGRIFTHFIKERNLASEEEGGVKLVFLGDYIDRAPHDIPCGGLYTLLFLISLKIFFPRDVILLRGNHEAYLLEKFIPYDLPDEIRAVFGEENVPSLHYKFLSIFDQLPLMARASNGIIASHACFPKDPELPLKEIKINDNESILRTLWGDPIESGTYRGSISGATRFNESDLESFLNISGSSIFVRGHDYNVKGYSMYSSKMLTIITSRRYEYKGAGGVFIAGSKVSNDREIRTVWDLNILNFLKDNLIEGEILEWGK